MICLDFLLLFHHQAICLCRRLLLTQCQTMHRRKLVRPLCLSQFRSPLLGRRVTPDNGPKMWDALPG